MPSTAATATRICALSGCSEPVTAPTASSRGGRPQIYCSPEHAHLAAEQAYRQRNRKRCPSCGRTIGMYSKTCVRCHRRGRGIRESSDNPAGQRILDICRLRDLPLKVGARTARVHFNTFDKLVLERTRSMTRTTAAKIATWDGDLDPAGWIALCGGTSEEKHSRTVKRQIAEAEAYSPGSSLPAVGFTNVKRRYHGRPGYGLRVMEALGKHGGEKRGPLTDVGKEKLRLAQLRVIDKLGRGPEYFSVMRKIRPDMTPLELQALADECTTRAARQLVIDQIDHRRGRRPGRRTARGPGRPPAINEEQLADFVRAGLSTALIAARLNVSARAVRMARQRHGYAARTGRPKKRN